MRALRESQSLCREISWHSFEMQARCHVGRSQYSLPTVRHKPFVVSADARRPGHAGRSPSSFWSLGCGIRSAARMQDLPARAGLRLNLAVAASTLERPGEGLAVSRHRSCHAEVSAMRLTRYTSVFRCTDKFRRWLWLHPRSSSVVRWARTGCRDRRHWRGGRAANR